MVSGLVFPGHSCRGSPNTSQGKGESWNAQFWGCYSDLNSTWFAKSLSLCQYTREFLNLLKFLAVAKQGQPAQFTADEIYHCTTQERKLYILSTSRYLSRLGNLQHLNFFHPICLISNKRSFTLYLSDYKINDRLKHKWGHVTTSKPHFLTHHICLSKTNNKNERISALKSSKDSYNSRFIYLEALLPDLIQTVLK